jgi:hypothetical protein
VGIGEKWDEYMCPQHVRRLGMSVGCVPLQRFSLESNTSRVHLDTLVTLQTIIRQNTYDFKLPGNRRDWHE